MKIILATAVGLMIIAQSEVHGMRHTPVCNVAYTVSGSGTLQQLAHSMWSAWYSWYAWRRRENIDLRFTIVYHDVPRRRIAELEDWGRNCLNVPVSFILFDPGSAEGFPPDQRNQATVMKVFLYKYVDAPKVIYLDTDVFVCEEGLRKLYEFELGDNICAVTLAPHLSKNRAEPWKKTFNPATEVCPVDEGVLIFNLTNPSKFEDIHNRWKTIRRRTEEEIRQKKTLSLIASGRPFGLAEINSHVDAKMQNLLICLEGVLAEMTEGIVYLSPEANTVVNMWLRVKYGNVSTPKLDDFVKYRKERFFIDYLEKRYTYRSRNIFERCVACCLKGRPIDPETAMSVYSAYYCWRQTLLGEPLSNFSDVAKIIISGLPSERLNDFAPIIALIFNMPQVELRANPLVNEIDEILRTGNTSIDADPKLQQMVSDWPNTEKAIMEYYSRRPWCLHDEGQPKLFADFAIFSPKYTHLQSILEVKVMAKKWGMFPPQTKEGLELSKRELIYYRLLQGPTKLEPAFLPWLRQFLYPGHFLNHVD